MNRSFRAPEREQMRSLRLRDNKDEELALFQEMRKREKERNNLLLLQSSDEFDAALGTKVGSSPIFNLTSATPVPARKTGPDEFLNSDGEKNDYEWLLTPPGTPLFPSLEMEQQRTVMNQLGTPKVRPSALRSRLAISEDEPAGRSNILSRPPASSLGLNTTGALRRPSSSGGSGSRPATPTGRPTLSRSTSSPASAKPALTTASKLTSLTSSKLTSTTSSRPSRSSTPTSRASLPSSKPTVPPRSATPTSRSTSLSSKPTVPPRSSTPTSRSTVRSSTPTTRQSLPASKSMSRAATPTRRTSMPSNPIKSTSTTSSSVIKPAARNPVPTVSNSPSTRPKPWNPSEMPGFSLDAPPNLRTSISDRPTSVTRGRPGAPSSRSSSVEPISNGRVRRQSCSPARGRPPNGITRSSGSSVPVPAVNRLHAKANDNVSPVVYGNKMVERVINMRKLAPPKQDDKHSPMNNFSGKSSLPDSSGFGRTLSKKSLDMAIRHMGIRQTVPGNLRPLMNNIPASSVYSVRSGHTKSRAVSMSDSALATSSASSEVSVNNNALCGSEGDDDVSSDKAPRSPASVRSRR